MHTIVFIPGIMGTRLSVKMDDGSLDEVWPPTVWEASGTYNRMSFLLQNDIIVGDIIDSVAAGCYKVYQPLIDDLSAIVKQSPATRRFVQFPYDWRQDLFKTAELLSWRLAAEANDATEITLIGHSMGGLIARLVLESPKYQSQPWHSKIKQFIAMATPHRGAPLALARALGLDSALGISAANFKTLAADPRYPSGYQLLPWQGDAVMWNRDPQTTLPLAPINFYQSPNDLRFGLNAHNLERATALQQALGPDAVRPSYVRYVTFVGTRYETICRVDVPAGGGFDVVKISDSGDGTVPSWSALLLASQHEYVGTDHGNVFTDNELRRTLYRLLGAALPGRPWTLDAAAAEIRLHLPHPVFSIASPADRATELHFELLPVTTGFTGTLVLKTASAVSNPPVFDQTVWSVPFTYQGLETGWLKLPLTLPTAPGLYELSFTGSGRICTAIQFAVQP